MFELSVKTQKSFVAVFLIVMMLFGSFGQVAHADTENSCLRHSEQATTNSIDKHCADQATFKKTQESKSDQNHSSGKSANHGCCAAHCCAMNPLDRAEYKLPHRLVKEKPLLVYETEHSSDFIFGIFRPPRLTV